MVVALGVGPSGTARDCRFLNGVVSFQGADVNSGRHKYRYTALHFGALSGNPAVCGLLLAAGAKSELTNTVGRTASQMGAFVGSYIS